MTRKQKIFTVVLVIIGVLSVIGVFIYYSTKSETESLRQELARVFNRPVELIELNLPPADGRYPGAVILSPQPGQTLLMRRVNRPELIPDNAVNLTVSVNANSQASLMSQLVGNMASAGEILLDVDLKELRLYEAELNNNFKQKLLEDFDVQRAEQGGLKPRAIVRTYEAIVSYTIQKNSSISGKAWEKVQDELINIGGSITNGGGIRITSSTPSVIAYETVFVNYVATSLSMGGSKEVVFREARADSTAGKLDISAFNLASGDEKVRYSLVGNSQFNSNAFGNLRVVEPSMELVQNVFQQAGARPILEGKPPVITNESGMDKTLKIINENLRSTPTSLFIFYYTGHAIAGPGGYLYLVLNDYTGDPTEDIEKDLFLGLPREQLADETSPLGGSNVDDLLSVVTALQEDYPMEVKGLYPVSKIASTLRDSGVPFVILIDACYGYEQMDDLRNELNLTKSGDYFGPDLMGGPQEVRRYADAIHRFGSAPYLASTNIVLLSSAPGSIALEVSDPRPQVGYRKFVAPLAFKIHNRFEKVLVNSTPVSWGIFFHSLVDVKPLGETRIIGAASWSNFDKAKQVPMFRR